MIRQNISPLSFPSGGEGISRKVNPGVRKTTNATSKSVIARWKMFTLYGLLSIPLFFMLTAQTKRLPTIVHRTTAEKEKRRNNDSSAFEYDRAMCCCPSENGKASVLFKTLSGSEEDQVAKTNVKFDVFDFDILRRGCDLSEPFRGQKSMPKFGNSQITFKGLI